MSDHKYMELVWEDGQILMRRLSPTPPCANYSSHPIKNVDDESRNDSNSHTTKIPRFGNVDSFLGGFPLIGDHRELAKHGQSVQDDRHPELYLENHEYDIYNKHVTEAHVVPGYINTNFRLGNASEFPAEVPEHATTRNGQLRRQHSLEQCKASVPFHRSRDGLPHSKLQQVDTEHGNHLWLQNFCFSSPALPKANQGSDARRPASVTGSATLERLNGNINKSPTGGGNPVESGQEEPTKYTSKIVKDFRGQQDTVATKLFSIRPFARSDPEEAPPDKQSEAEVPTSNGCSDQVVHRITPSSAPKTINAEPATGKPIDQRAATASICSFGASNDLPSRKTCDAAKGMVPCSSNDDEEEQVRTKKQEQSAGRRKRRRAAGVHNESERRRRNKISKKMRALQDLIPNSNKVNKASMLEEAIDYLKSLQLQVQLMSMWTGLCTPPTILPLGLMQHIVQAPQFFPVGVGMGTRMPMGWGCSPAPLSAPTMLGLPPGQMLPMSISQAPFIPWNVRGHSTGGMSEVSRIQLEFRRSDPFSFSAIRTPEDQLK